MSNGNTYLAVTFSDVPTKLVIIKVTASDDLAPFMENLALNFKVRAFGVAREILGGREKTVVCGGQTVADLKATLYKDFPALNGLKSLFIAVNNEYAKDEVVIHETDEIALIPPVSGG